MRGGIILRPVATTRANHAPPAVYRQPPVCQHSHLAALRPLPPLPPARLAHRRATRLFLQRRAVAAAFPRQRLVRLVSAYVHPGARAHLPQKPDSPPLEPAHPRLRRTRPHRLRRIRALAWPMAMDANRRTACHRPARLSLRARSRHARREPATAHAGRRRAFAMGTRAGKLRTNLHPGRRHRADGSGATRTASPARTRP